MKKAFIFMLICGMISGSQLYAQNNTGKGNTKPDKEQKDKPQGHENKKDNDNSKGNQVKDQKMTKDNQGKGHDKDKEDHGKGNAYGKNKDSLQGREFGQNRANEAKSKNHQEALQKTETNVNQVSKTNEDTKNKIKQAYGNLEKKKKDKKITEAEYNKQKQELDNLEKQVNDLEMQNTGVKTQLEQQKQVKTK